MAEHRSRSEAPDHGPIEFARFHTDMFISGKSVTPNGPASVKDGWELIEDGEFLWMRYRGNGWGRVHASNVRYVQYAPPRAQASTIVA